MFKIYLFLCRESKVVAILDPTLLEEKVADGNLTITLTRHGDLITVIKTGGVAANLDLFHTECLNVAQKRTILISDKLNAALSARPK